MIAWSLSLAAEHYLSSGWRFRMIALLTPSVPRPRVLYEPPQPNSNPEPLGPIPDIWARPADILNLPDRRGLDEDIYTHHGISVWMRAVLTAGFGKACPVCLWARRRTCCARPCVAWFINPPSCYRAARRLLETRRAGLSSPKLTPHWGWHTTHRNIRWVKVQCLRCRLTYQLDGTLLRHTFRPRALAPPPSTILPHLTALTLPPLKNNSSAPPLFNSWRPSIPNVPHCRLTMPSPPFAFASPPPIPLPKVVSRTHSRMLTPSFSPSIPSTHNNVSST